MDRSTNFSPLRWARKGNKMKKIIVANIKEAKEEMKKAGCDFEHVKYNEKSGTYLKSMNNPDEEIRIEIIA